jgi:hypothetical protein
VSARERGAARVRRASAFLAAGLAACAASRTAPSGTPSASAEPRVVALSEVPAAQREAWQAWMQGGAAWDLALERVRRDPEVARFVVDNLVRVMVRSYDRSALATAGKAPGPFERAQQDLVALAAFSTPVLAELLRLPDGVVAFLAADRLVAIGAPATAGAVPLLGDGRPETRRRAAELLGRLPHAGADEIALEQKLAALVAGDAEWAVRAEAARALGARGARHSHKGYALGVLGRALADPDPAVVRSAVAGLEALGEPSAIPRLADALERAVAAGDVGLTQAIQRALARLSGDERPRTPAEWRRFEPRAAPQAPGRR